MRRRFPAFPVLAAVALASEAAAGAENRIDIWRGADTVVHGSCVPSLKAVNNTAVVIDYLEIRLAFALRSGETRILEFRSRYREGIERPIRQGMTADLTVQLDLTKPLGVACADIVDVRVAGAVCEAAGKPCSGIILLHPTTR